MIMISTKNPAITSKILNIARKSSKIQPDIDKNNETYLGITIIENYFSITTKSSAKLKLP